MQRYILALMLAVGPLAASADPLVPLAGPVNPVRNVIEAAAAAEGEAVHATIEIVVQGTGRERNLLYLNSERDYRDPRNITIVLLPSSIADLQQRFGEKLPGALLGKRIRVEGPARLVTIWFNCQGVRTDKYYFQTHLRVTDGQQVQRVF